MFKILAMICVLTIPISASEPEVKSNGAQEKDPVVAQEIDIKKFAKLRELDAKILSAKPFLISSVADVPSVCARIAGVLQAQPRFHDVCNMVEKVVKVLPIARWDLCAICDIVNNDSNQKLKQNRRWLFTKFGCSVTLVSHGLRLEIYDTIYPCQISDLQKMYHTVIDAFTHGWEQANATEWPNILDKQNPDYWYLFLKHNKKPSEEYVLIYPLASYLKIDQYVKCSNLWKDPLKGLKSAPILYLWVQKKAYEQVAKMLYPMLPANAKEHLQSAAIG